MILIQIRNEYLNSLLYCGNLKKCNREKLCNVVNRVEVVLGGRVEQKYYICNGRI